MFISCYPFRVYSEPQYPKFPVLFAFSLVETHVYTFPLSVYNVWLFVIRHTSSQTLLLNPRHCVASALVEPNDNSELDLSFVRAHRAPSTS
jgi:hypothetical protein